MMNPILKEDLSYILDSLSKEEQKAFDGSTILLTGCAGFLGFYFMNFFAHYKKELNIKEIIGLDNFLVGKPNWLKAIEGEISLHTFNVITDDIASIKGAENADFVYHMASVASPKFYRMYPLETLDSNISGLRRLLDFYCEKKLKGFVFYSSSEIYGDPTPENIPTPETYWGNVSCIGPRACYDEAKRVGETICFLFHKQYQMPIRIIRPFNNYGPGMRLNDARVPADFAKAVFENQDITMLSDGSPTRTFCYIADAIVGHLKVLLHHDFDFFNIGMDKPEISIKELAAIYETAGKKVFDYSGTVSFAQSDDRDYLVNNPNRRCPDLTKARTVLGYNPRIDVADGVTRFLEFIKASEKEDLEW